MTEWVSIYDCKFRFVTRLNRVVLEVRWNEGSQLIDARVFYTITSTCRACRTRASTTLSEYYLKYCNERITLIQLFPHWNDLRTLI